MTTKSAAMSKFLKSRSVMAVVQEQSSPAAGAVDYYNNEYTMRACACGWVRGQGTARVTAGQDGGDGH